MKYFNKITGYPVTEKEIKFNHPEDHAEFIENELAAGRYENIYTIGRTEITESDAWKIYEAGKYILNYSGVWQICYSQAQRRFYGMNVYNHKGMARRGRFYTLTGAEVNRLVGFNLLA